MEVRATRFVLEDGMGKDRMVLGFERNQPKMTMIDLNGDPVVSISINPDTLSGDIIITGPHGSPLLRINIAGQTNNGLSTIISLIGDYPGQGRKEIIIRNGDLVSEPSIALHSNGTTIAHVP